MNTFFGISTRANRPRRNVAIISGGSVHTFALDKNGRAWGWGFNGYAALGDNTVTQRLTPVNVLGTIKTFCQINAGSSDTVAIDKNGRAWGWGYNGTGQLGNNSIVSQLTPVSVLGTIKTFCQISAGAGHTVAIAKNGRAWGWGEGSQGQLGNNSLLTQLTPVSVLGTIKTFCQINAGDYFTVAIDKNGRAWGWGYNGVGQLGNNSIVSQLTPVSVLGTIKTFCQINAGGSRHTVAIDKNGGAWCWGRNINGQLGNNSTISQRTPVSVLGTIKTFCQISGGNNHTVAIDKNGRAWGWGYNYFGQLGNNSIVSQLTPVSVLGTIKTFCQISGGSSSHTVAIDKNGGAWAWGYNVFGQLGDNSTISQLTPVRICNI